MIDCGLQEFGHIVGQIPVGWVIEPSQLGNATNQFDEGQDEKILQRWTLVRQVPQDIVPNVNPLWNGETVPMDGDELNETVRGHQSSVLRIGIVQNVLTLGNVFGIGLETQ